MEEYGGYRVRHIPENFSGGVNILGMHFETVFLVEGIILAVTLFAGIFVPLCLFGVSDIPAAAGISLAFSGAGLFAGVRGVNDEPLGTFLRAVVLFYKKRRTLLFNPRVKLEAVPSGRDGAGQGATAGERLSDAVTKYRRGRGIKSGETAAEGVFETETVYFSDDVGVIRNPDDGKSERGGGTAPERRAGTGKRLLEEKRREERLYENGEKRKRAAGIDPAGGPGEGH